MTPVVLVLEKFSIKSQKWSYIFLLHYALWLVYKIHATTLDFAICVFPRCKQLACLNI